MEVPVRVELVHANKTVLVNTVIRVPIQVKEKNVVERKVYLMYVLGIVRLKEAMLNVRE